MTGWLPPRAFRERGVGGVRARSAVLFIYTVWHYYTNKLAIMEIPTNPPTVDHQPQMGKLLISDS